MTKTFFFLFGWVVPMVL